MELMQGREGAREEDEVEAERVAHPKEPRAAPAAAFSIIFHSRIYLRNKKNIDSTVTI